MDEAYYMKNNSLLAYAKNIQPKSECEMSDYKYGHINNKI